jgi:hypothetical protein
MCSSPYISGVQEDADIWLYKLAHFDNVLQEWIHCQQLW